MLRITVHDNPRALTFQLEGSLAGPWVRVLEECWQGTLARRRRPNLRVDLTGVTFIDAAGKACLAAMHRQGAEFVAADCLTKAVVAEITQGPHSRRGVPEWQRRKPAVTEPRCNMTTNADDSLPGGRLWPGQPSSGLPDWSSSDSWAGFGFSRRTTRPGEPSHLSRPWLSPRSSASRGILSRACADNGVWRAALDRYAEQEEAKRT